MITEIVQSNSDHAAQKSKPLPPIPEPKIINKPLVRPSKPLPPLPVKNETKEETDNGIDKDSNKPSISTSAGSGSSRYRITNDGELINKPRTSSKREEAKQATDVFEYSDGTKMRLELYVPKEGAFMPYVSYIDAANEVVLMYEG